MVANKVHIDRDGTVTEVKTHGTVYAKGVAGYTRYFHDGQSEAEQGDLSGFGYKNRRQAADALILLLDDLGSGDQ